LVEHIKYMGETHIECTETFTGRNAHLIETKRSPLKRTLIVTTFVGRNAHLIETKHSPLKRTLIVTTFVARNAHLIETKRSPLIRTLIVTTFANAPLNTLILILYTVYPTASTLRLPLYILSAVDAYQKAYGTGKT